ncbi:MAG: hypothetical protein ACRD1E_04815, partial [Terriglobales bacterium]
MSSPPVNPYTGRARRLVRLRQLLAWGLLAAALAVAGLYGWRRLGQRRQVRAHPGAKVALLGLTVEQSAAGVTIAKSEGGRPVFKLFAQRADKMRSGGRDLLHQVRIEVYDQDGIHADEISGEQFAYAEASGELTAAGEVHIRLQARPGGRSQNSGPVDITARDLSYNVKRGTGSIAQGISFSLGGARGTAGSAQLDSRNGRADIGGGVALHWQRAGQPELSVSSRQAQLQRLDPPAPDAVRVRLQGQATVASGDASLHADELDLFVRADQSLRHLDASGQVAGEESSGARRLQMRARRAQADFADDGAQTLTGLELSGGAGIAQSGANGTSALQAGTMQFGLDADGNLRRLQARKNAVLQISGANPGSLAAPELDFEFAPGQDARAPQLRAIA